MQNTFREFYRGGRGGVAAVFGAMMASFRRGCIIVVAVVVVLVLRFDATAAFVFSFILPPLLLSL
jgi:hypothetical protein